MADVLEKLHSSQFEAGLKRESQRKINERSRSDERKSEDARFLPVGGFSSSRPRLDRKQERGVKADH